MDRPPLYHEPRFLTSAVIQCLHPYQDAEMLREASLASSRAKDKDEKVASTDQ